jgi:hypothetical protein
MIKDGERLYVDRNANGDLTEPDESFAPTESHQFTTIRGVAAAGRRPTTPSWPRGIERASRHPSIPASWHTLTWDRPPPRSRNEARSFVKSGQYDRALCTRGTTFQSRGSHELQPLACLHHDLLGAGGRSLFCWGPD